MGRVGDNFNKEIGLIFLLRMIQADVMRFLVAVAMVMVMVCKVEAVVIFSCL